MNVTFNPTISQTEKWEEFLKNHPHNTIFQSPEMYHFYKKVQGFEPYIFFAEENDKVKGVLLAVLIKEGNGIKGFLSSRVVVYGGPLIEAENNLKTLDLLLSKLVEKLKNKSIFIQFRNFFEWDENEKDLFVKYGFEFKDRLNLLINTTDKEIVWKGISTGRRRQINKAFKEGVYIEEPLSIKEMEEFYYNLRRLYKFKVKKPLPDWSFFKEFYNFSSKNKLGKIFLVKKDKKIIGGILLPVTPETNVYEWYIFGLDKKYKKLYPSVIATWAALKYSYENSYKFFDFMGLGVPDKEYGVREFKKRFGGKLVNYGRYSRRNFNFLYNFVELGYNTYRWLNKI